jgi:hypothetical protein
MSGVMAERGETDSSPDRPGRFGGLAVETEGRPLIELPRRPDRVHSAGRERRTVGCPLCRSSAIP